MGRLGKAIDGARSVYGDAIGKLSTGKGNLVRQVEQLRELGARTGKSLPAAMLDDGAELALANEAAALPGPQP
jgi:DNA recombination protein RmuC